MAEVLEGFVVGRLRSFGVLSAVLVVLGLVLASPVGAVDSRAPAGSFASGLGSNNPGLALRFAAASSATDAGVRAALAEGDGSELFNGVQPARLVDTRAGRTTVDGQNAGSGPAAGKHSFVVTGRGGLPTTGVGAVVLNVTVTGSILNGYATVFPSGETQPNASNLNFLAGETVPNSVIAKVGVGGAVSVFTSTTADVLVDVSGWLPEDSDYSGLVPARLADSRVGRSTVDDAERGFGAFKDVRSVQVAGRGGVPPVGAGAVVLNVTLANGITDGYSTVFPSDESKPNTSSVNFARSRSVANLVIAKLGTDGKVNLFNSNTADVIIDVAGWLPSGSDYISLVPARLVDSRPGRDTIDGAERRFGAFEGVRDFKMTDRAGIPVDAGVVVLNVTVTGSETNGYSTVFPAGESAPNASNLNYLQGRTAANLVVATVGAGGKVSVLNSTKAHVIIDVAGWIPSPTEAGEPIQFKQISTGGTETGSGHTCGVTLAGAAKCWGSNSSGQLGDGTTADRSRPVTVSGLGSGVASISAGGTHTCAGTTAGATKCWGSNTAGQLGDGTTADRSRPVSVSSLESGTSSVASGGTHTCVVTADGAVRCWGKNDDGQLGDGSTDNRTMPTDVWGLSSEVHSVSVGWEHSCAVTETGEATCWGKNYDGQLGNGMNSNQLTPLTVSGLRSDVRSTSLGDRHSCAVMADGSARCWGYNDHGQLGLGTTIQKLLPTTLESLGKGVESPSVGATHTCAAMVDGSAKCWGYNDHGQLGDGTTTERLSPTPVSRLASGVVAISAGRSHSCALLASGVARCWGDNARGQLGDGTTTNRLAPVDVKAGV